jgi:hypothetical protein
MRERLYTEGRPCLRIPVANVSDQDPDWISILTGWIRIPTGWIRIPTGWIRIPTGWIQILTGSGFKWIRGSEPGLGIRLRIQADKNCPPKREFFFHVKRIFWSLNVLRTGTGLKTYDGFCRKFFFLCHKESWYGSWISKTMPGSGSETLLMSHGYNNTVTWEFFMVRMSEPLPLFTSMEVEQLCLARIAQWRAVLPWDENHKE